MSIAEHPRGQSDDARLVRLGFRDTEQVATLLAEVPGLLLDGPAAADGTEPALLGDLAEQAADPDLALRTLVRILAATSAPADLAAALGEQGLRRRLYAVLGASAALGDHLVRHPDDWRLLRDDSLEESRPSGYGLRRRLLEAVGADPDAPSPGLAGGRRAKLSERAAMDALRLAYWRSVLELAARDLSGEVDVEDVAAELADLACAALEAALAISAAKLPKGAAQCRFAVIGMGKTGGHELNYVSDVDVIFVAEAVDGPDGPADEAAAIATGTRLATGLIKACSTTTSEGTLWPVDAALRPEGKDGPLVRSLVSHEAYYRRWARTWEFQALLKARPAAGDRDLGERYVDTVAPLVWSAGDRPHFVEDVQAMRRRVEEHIPRKEVDRELKLGPGGLRDVEFAVQLLQLVHGRTDPSLHSPSTLVALEALTVGGYVGRADGARLAESYRWLRTVEHRVQLQRLRRTHLVPEDPATLRWVARATGYRGDAVAEFQRDRARHGREVRRLHEKLFYRPLLAAVARLHGDEARLSPAAASERLQALGFDDPAGALRHLEALANGVSRRASIQRTLLPAMLGWFADAADPDAGLLAFRLVSEKLGSTPWYLRLLRDEGAAAERLAHLLASSRYVADMFGRAPESIALLADDNELVPRTRAQLDERVLAVVERNDGWESAVVAARGVRRQELLRIACADLLGLVRPEAVGRALADSAGATVGAALRVALRKVEVERRGPVPVRLGIIAMGRLGGHEQGYGSDADVLFVHDPIDGVPDDVAAAAAQAVAEELRRLLLLPAQDPPLLVDADLRPEGRQGPLTRSLAAYREYYARWSHVWEAQALLRAAHLAGDAGLTGEFLDQIAPVRWPEGGLDEAARREIRRIKSRVEAERLPRGTDPQSHLKLGPGGLSDVEWTVQMLQLQHAFAVPELRTTSTLGALAAAEQAGLLDPADAAVLSAAWELATRARNALTLVRGKPGDNLPPVGRDLAGVARAVGYPAGHTGDFLEDYRRTTRRARAVVERVFYT
ncbi:MAG: [glutamine synthetase] adenylyltransferase / [glutamine synthetase]-adenylyl-L-tyrosine [Frankiales bacterium]|nr:[glutamine synthetase] adenylyltransferase / [glutamine synthetase]-adenylyl-L-tyrosine [Frankiales bacterium]